MALFGRARRRGVIVTGDRELDAQLAKLEPTIQKKVGRKALRNAGKLIRDQAKAKLSQNDNVDTGELQSGIKVKSGKRSRSRISIEVVTTEHTSGKMTDGKRFGGAQLETGTKHMKASPFLRPALHENRFKIEEMVKQDIRDAIGVLSIGLPLAAAGKKLVIGKSGARFFVDAAGKFQKEAGGFASKALLQSEGLK